MGQKYCCLLIGFICLISYHSVFSQSPGDTLITLNGAIQLGMDKFHLLKSSKYEAEAAVKNQESIKFSRRPTLEAGYQANLSTANNLMGVFYPAGMIPMTGPPSDFNDYHPAVGSAVNLLMNWQVLSFGLENSKSNLAAAQADSKELNWKQEIFRFKINLISVYLDLLLASSQLDIRLHNIERLQSNVNESRVLVKTGIKPGVDTALFLSELSKARVNWLQSSQKMIACQLALDRLMVSQLRPIPVDTGFLNRLPGVQSYAGYNNANHPFIKYFQELVTTNKLNEQLIKKSNLPKLNVWGTAFARGSGFYADKTIKTFEGVGFSRYNYGAGFQLSFSILKYVDIKRQLEQQQLITKSNQELLEDQQEALGQQLKMANESFNNSVTVVKETQLQLSQAQYAFNAMKIRYNTGLVNFADLIQVEYSLLEAELGLKVAFWNSWKSLLCQAAAAGDEFIFLNDVK